MINNGARNYEAREIAGATGEIVRLKYIVDDNNV